MRSSALVIAAFAMVFSIFVSGTGHAQKKSKVKVYDEVGPWRVLAVWSKKHQKRLVCSAYHQLDSRLGRLFVVTFSKDSDDEWKIEFLNEQWPIRTQAAIEGSLVDLDTNETISGDAPFHRDKSITFPIGNSVGQIQKFQKKDKLHLEVKSPAFRDKLELPMTKAVIDRINSCHTDNRQ